jgi:hypothetical protein
MTAAPNEFRAADLQFHSRREQQFDDGAAPARPAPRHLALAQDQRQQRLPVAPGDLPRVKLEARKAATVAELCDAYLEAAKACGMRQGTKGVALPLSIVGSPPLHRWPECRSQIIGRRPGFDAKELKQEFPRPARAPALPDAHTSHLGISKGGPHQESALRRGANRARMLSG